MFLFKVLKLALIKKEFNRGVKMKKSMKFILAVALTLLCASECLAGSFTDSRDGKTYKTVKMPDGKTWMAENLNYKMNGSMCYENNAANCSMGGQLYEWKAAKRACPSGWHLPSREEFLAMLKSIDENANNIGLGGKILKKLRASSWVASWSITYGGGVREVTVCAKYACSYGYGSTIRDCNGSGKCNCGSGESICLEYKRQKEKIPVTQKRHDDAGSDEFGFSALPAGSCTKFHGELRSCGGFFDNTFSITGFWSSSEYYDHAAAYNVERNVYNGYLPKGTKYYPDVYYLNINNRGGGIESRSNDPDRSNSLYSVRCVQD